MAVSSKEQAEQLLRDLTGCLHRLESIDARIAAAYLDSAIEALCREHGLERSSSETD